MHLGDAVIYTYYFPWKDTEKKAILIYSSAWFNFFLHVNHVYAYFNKAIEKHHLN